VGTPILAFDVLQIFTLLTWAAWFVLTLWAWQKTKGTGYLLMMIGTAGLTLFDFLGALGTSISPEGVAWLGWICLVLIVVGFYLLVAPLVAGHIASLKSRMQAPQSPPPGGSPPK
jgi:hypothetical protein